MNENDAWNTFVKTGSVQDYLKYKATQNSTANCGKNTNENTDGRTDNQTTEYR